MTIPAQWRALMARVNQVAPSAVLAGGALRDLNNDRPVKDLDIFIHGEEDVDAALKLLESLGYVVSVTFSGDYVDAAKDVSFAYAAKRAGEIDINIVELRDPTSPLQCIERMDFGICQVAYTGHPEGGIIATASYWNDVANQTITMTRADSLAGFKWSMRRYERLAHKYPWRLVVPDEYACFEEAMHLEACAETPEDGRIYGGVIVPGLGRVIAMCPPDRDDYEPVIREAA